MSRSSLTIEEVLGPGGLLARSISHFEFRPSQLDMAHLVWRAVNEGIPAMVEAGTGTGKTLGYLVPLVLSGAKAVISTGTKNLQEQIFLKDIPLIEKATSIRAGAMMMKGRQNYLCLYRYRQHFAQLSVLSPELRQVGRKLEDWLRKTESGDRAELTWLADDDPLWASVSSNSDQCLAGECLFFEDCFLNRLRAQAAKAKLIVVNHHLLFADLKVKRRGFGEVIPRFQVALFDEAHALEEVATAHFGESLGTAQLADLANELEKEVKGLRVFQDKDFKTHLIGLRAGAEQLREALWSSAEKGRLDPQRLSSLSQGPGREIRKALKGLQNWGISVKQDTPQIRALLNRCAEMEFLVERILEAKEGEWLNWWEKGRRSIRIHLSPLDISGPMKEFLYDNVKTTIFTSATLSTSGNFDYARSRLGLADCRVLEGLYPSHFRFQDQALLYVPKDLPPPNDPGFVSRAAERVREILERSLGRALVLFTSHSNMNFVYHYLKERRIPYALYRQGEAPKTALLEAFKRDTHSVLLATGSFWEGVDVPGEALSCLIVDKLPFDSPGEPVIAARIDTIREKGGNPFWQYQVPSAVISLKQGFGRLIRTSSDRGILSILDIRILRSRYGKIFLNSLPSMRMCHELEAITRFFEKKGGAPDDPETVEVDLQQAG